MPVHTRICLGLSFVMLLEASMVAASSPPTRSAEAQTNSAVAKDFENRVAKYLTLRKKEAGGSPKSTNSPDQLADQRHAAAARLREARVDAKQGDIFTPEISDYFKRQIAASLTGPEGARTRKSLQHAEPVRGISLQVNQPYPDGLPLQSMPPTLLMNLPKLPKELEYRIVGRDLILYDTVPNMVVDFIPGAVPSVTQ
jgi:hypothetical protein